MGLPTQRFDIKTHPLWGKCSVGDNVYISDIVRVRGKLDRIEISNAVSINDFSVLMAEAPIRIGHGCRLSYGVVVLAYAPIRICANAKIGPGVKIISAIADDDGREVKPIEIGTGAVIGAGAVILPGAEVPAGYIVKPNEVYSGSRDSEIRRPVAI